MGNQFPNTLKEITRARYKFVEILTCSLCDAPVQHWKTTHNKDIHFNPMVKDNDEAVRHEATCPVLEAKREEAFRQSQPIHRFAKQMRAAVVIVVDAECGVDFSLANDCYSDPAELHNAITKAADDVSIMLTNRFSQPEAGQC